MMHYEAFMLYLWRYISIAEEISFFCKPRSSDSKIGKFTWSILRLSRVSVFTDKSELLSNLVRELDHCSTVAGNQGWTKHSSVIRKKREDFSCWCMNSCFRKPSFFLKKPHFVTNGQKQLQNTTVTKYS